MKVKCVKPFSVEKYDDNGFPTDKYMQIPIESVWEIDEDPYRFVGNDDSIRLFRVWKCKNPKTIPWIEISKELFEECFEQLKEKADEP